MNILATAAGSKPLVHYTTAAEELGRQAAAKPTCANRWIYGYVYGGDNPKAPAVTCPRCLAA